MEPQTDRYTKMRETSLDAQRKRQCISPTWEPNGFERYVYQRAVTRALPVVTGVMTPQDRYKPAMSCQDTLDCQCGKDHKVNG